VVSSSLLADQETCCVNRVSASLGSLTQLVLEVGNVGRGVVGILHDVPSDGSYIDRERSKHQLPTREPAIAQTIEVG
jgi:hypothetical protein